jgi:hypothetical protein
VRREAARRDAPLSAPQEPSTPESTGASLAPVSTAAASFGAEPSSGAAPESQSNAEGQAQAPLVHVQLEAITVVVPSHAGLGVERLYGHWS